MENMTPIQAFQAREIRAAQAAGAPMFLGLPDAWYEPSHWACENGHVTRWYVKSGKGCMCPACFAPLYLIPAGYTDETLAAALAVIAAEGGAHG